MTPNLTDLLLNSSGPNQLISSLLSPGISQTVQPKVGRRANQARMLLESIYNPKGPGDESLSRSYFRRSLDIIKQPERFLGLVVLAPSYAGKKGAVEARRARRIFRNERELFNLILTFHSWPLTLKPSEVLEAAVSNDSGRRYLGINTHQGIGWYNRERFGDFIFRLYSCGIISGSPEDELFSVVGRWVDAGHRSGYKVAELLEAARE